MEIIHFFENHGPTALLKYAEECEDIHPPTWHVVVITTSSLILCLSTTTIGIISLLVIIDNSQRRKLRHSRRKRTDNSRSNSSITHGSGSSRNTVGGSLSVHTQPLLMDTDKLSQNQSHPKTMNRIHTLLCCCQCCKCCQCTTKCLVKSRNKFSLIAIICLMLTTWLQMFEVLTCQLTGIYDDVIDVHLGFEISTEMLLLTYHFGMLIFLLVIILRLYLSFMDATLYSFRYPTGLFRFLLIFTIFCGITVISFTFLFLYSIDLGLIISGIYQLIYVSLCFFLLIIFLKKLSFIIKLPSYASNQYHSIVNIMVKYTVLTLLAMISGIVVSLFSIFRYLAPTKSAGTVLYYIETQVIIIDCLLQILAVYFQHSFTANTYYKYLGCLDDLIRFGLTCCLSKRNATSPSVGLINGGINDNNINGPYPISLENTGSNSSNNNNNNGGMSSRIFRSGLSPRKTDVDISRVTTTKGIEDRPYFSNHPSSELTSVSASLNQQPNQNGILGGYSGKAGYKYSRAVPKDIKIRWANDVTGNETDPPDEYENYDSRSSSFVQVHVYDRE